MAYTAKGDYYDLGVSAADKAAIEGYQRQWAAANAAGDEAGKAAAHAGAEAIRAGYGYSGGGDGTEKLALTQQQLQQQQARQAAALQSMLGEYRNAYSSQNSAQQQALAAQRAANEAAVQKAVSSLESQKASTDRQYAELFRQLYVDKMKNQKNMGQQLAAGGITGGAAESTMLGYDTAYEDALRQGEQGRINALGGLDRAITDARLTGDISNAEAAASAAQGQADGYADALKYLISRQDTLNARQEAYAREDARRAAAYARQLAEAEQEAEEKASKPALTVAQVNAAVKAGVLTDAVLAAYEYYYGAPYRR